ncbi:hypothetical protein FA13DRAFT_508271 [Coprinellus micaceus]|uniref:F-box domain-containing protein n=1 Tax=Coprinellus micaceus TaxID=71717 RepID=A0A4Y7SC22_COPMI|nr:hypothetical protein FA13DRAFT_508271 [Coprinellus micaceus]
MTRRRNGLGLRHDGLACLDGDHRSRLQVLPQLPSLRSLTVTTYTPDTFTDWANVPPDLQDALFHCFSLSTLEELVLECVVNMEITPLIDCPSLTNLSLTGLRCQRRIWGLWGRRSLWT